MKEGVSETNSTKEGTTHEAFVYSDNDCPAGLGKFFLGGKHPVLELRGPLYRAAAAELPQLPVPL
jgi:hypothetical protein